MKRIFTSLVMVLGFVMQSQAQMQNMNSACEQNPCQALPVCATTTTNPYSYQSNTGNPGVAATGCGNSIGGTVAYAQNWMYYRFTCQSAGTLNFTITPNDPSSDLDWAMWNVTNSGCGGIATGNLVECNSFPGLGGTGMQAIAAQAFEPQITLVAGNTYILGVSRRSGGTATVPPSGPPYATGSAGFSINFAGTANIINSTAPALLSVIPYDPCAPLTQLRLRMTQQVRCFQINANDFSFTGGGTVPTFTASGGASCPGCTGTTGFNWSNVSDTITINFSSPLPAGNYTISLAGVNPFSSLCGIPANTAITLPLSVSANLNDSIRTGFSCASLTYVDTVYGKNGVSPYQFKSQGTGQSNTYGAATPSFNVFTGLTGGNTYTFTVKDATGCTADSVLLHPPYIPLGITTFKKDPPCTNQFTKDTFRVVNTNGGAAPFTYALTSTPAAASATAIQYAPGAWNNLQQGSFTITCTDKWGCTATAVANIANPPVVTFPTPSSTNPQCFGDSTGTITVNASGGSGVMSYTVVPTPPTVILPAPGYFTQVIGGLPGAVSPGTTYTITVSDVNGCSATNTRTLTTPAALNVSTAAATRVNPTCVNPCGGSYAPVASGGTGSKKFYRLPLVTAPNTYTDSVVVSGGSFQNLCQGTYTVRCVDILGCNTTVTVTLTLPPIPDIVNNSVTNVTCFGLCNGQILNTTTGGTTPYAYSITPSNNPPCGNAVLFGTGGDYQNLPAGTYKVVVTSPNQCKDSVENIVITQPLAITWNSVTQTNILCFGNNTGSVSVNAAGGTGGINYSITPLGPQFGPSGNFNNLTAQQYTVTASDANSCSTTTTVLLTEPPVLFYSSVVANPSTCNGANNGSIVVTTFGGNGGASYTINPNPNSVGPTTSGAFMNLPVNTYTVTATDGNGCTKTTTATITQPAPILITSATFVSPSCFGGSNGTATVVATGGFGTKTYTINPLGPQSNTTGNFNLLTVGIYTITVSDTFACSTSTTINIVQPTQVNFVNASFTQPSCGGNSNGTISVVATGGTGSKTYSIDPLGPQTNTTGNFSGLTAGQYTITAADQNVCLTVTIVDVTEPTPLLFTSANFTQPLCFNGTNGTISVTTTGGTGGKTYTITPLGPQSNNTGNFSNLSAQCYTITATDVNGCTKTTTVCITQPTQLTFTSASSAQPSCNGGANGGVTVVANGGTPGYNYSITPLGPQTNTTGSWTNLTAQCYTVTATDVNGCTVTTSVCVTQPTPVVATITGTTSPTCTPGCDGTITVSGSGGTPTYTASTPTLTQSPANTFNGACASTPYVITITDANGCTATTSTTLAVPSSPTPAAVAVTSVSCNGQCNGTAQVTIAPNINYVITPNNPGQSFNPVTGVVSGLCAGTYTVTATNALSCVGTTTFGITQPAVLTLAINTSTNPTCVPSNNGTATVTSTGGNGSNVYTIAPTVPSGSINATTGNASNLAPGVTYIITVTDVKGCTSTTTITPATPVSPVITSASVTQPLCNGNNNGSITVTAIGNGTITYTITPLGPQSNTTGIFSNLTAQQYTVTATTANGCTGTSVVVVTQPTVLAFNSSSFTQPSCNGLNDGTATVVASGGTAGYTYTITPLGPQTNNTGNFGNLTAQCYTVTVTDANSCTATTTFCVTQPTPVVVNVTGTTSPTCTPGCDGTITVTSGGGTNPITLLSAPFLTQSPAGTFINTCAATAYVITASDANGCTASTSTTLSTPNAPTPVAVGLTTVSCNGQCDGTAQVSIASGITYTIAPINPGQSFNPVTGVVTGLCAGTYTVTATNALSCVGTTTFLMIQPGVLTLAINSSTDPTCVPSNNGTATVTSTGGSGSNVYFIAPTVPSGSINSSTGNASNLAPGVTYIITVSDINGCTNTTTITPATPASPVITSASVTQPLCNGNNNGSITVTASGNGTITYTITPLGPQSNTTGIFSNLTAQQYTVTATTANGCTGTSIVVVTQPNVLAFNSASFTQPSCNGLNDGTATVVASGGTTNYTYTINPLGPQSNNTGNFGNLTAQCYTVTVTDANNCTATTTFCVTQPTPVVVNVTGTTSPTCTPGCDGTITVTTSGGTSPIASTINPFLTQSPAGTFINACAATAYVITATDANGCTASTSTTLSTPNAPIPSAVVVSTVSCNGLCNGSAQVSIAPNINYVITPNNPGQSFNPVTGVVSGLCAGTYTVTATNALSCVGTTTFLIIQPGVLTLAINSSTDPTCVPSNNGTATVTSTGGSGSNVYSIAPTVPSGSINSINGNASNLAPGVTYIITVTDINGCTSTTSITPATPVSPVWNYQAFTQPLCNGNNNGTITVVAQSPLPITYTITPLGPQSNTSGNFSNLTAQSYTVTATTTNGCTASIVIVVTEPNVLAFNSSSFTQPSCNGLNDGTATVVASGGTTNYTYTINPLGPQSNNTGNFGNLTAQCYTVTVTDANNCTATTTFCVTQPTAVSVSVTATTSPTCTPGCDGTITVTAGGGTNPITLLSAPFLTQSPAGTFINACAATNYVITATDANGCTANTSTTLSTPNAPTPVAVGVTNVSCIGQCNGTAQVNIVPNINYVITPNNPGQSFNPVTGVVSGLCAGTYTVTATNALSCVGTTTFAISQPAVLTLAINSSTDPTCVPSNNGTATVTSTGGSGSNVYSIAPTVPSGSINSSTGSASNLAPGVTYIITVTDINGCTSTTSITPATPVSPVINSATFTQPLCNGNNNGTMTVVATGSPTFTIAPLGPQSNITGNFSNLTAQCYTVTATTANGCTAISQVCVTQPNVLAFNSASFTQPSCNGLNDGTATVVASGGTPNYTYTINPLGPQSNTTGNFGNLTAQCYTVTVTDANGCTATTTFCVTQPTAVAVSVTATTSPTCTPGCDGTITVTTSGGTSPIASTINPFLTQSPAGTFINACAATNYVITATDANGCSASTSTTLTTPNAPTPVAVAVTNVSCNGQCNGTAQVTIVPNINYVITPNNPGQSFNPVTGVVSGLCAGTYTVTATNALSCVGTTTFAITQPAVLTLAINTTTDPTCVPSNNGTATVTSTGGNGTNVYTIAPTVPSGSINATTGNASNLAPGVTYIITVTDINGCTSTTSITPATPVSPVITSASVTQPLCNGNNNGGITVTATGNGTITYTITPLGPQSNTTGIFSNLTAQQYTVTATTANGCTGTSVVVVTQPNVLAFNSASFTQPSCFGGSNGTATVVASGGTTNYTYTINPLGPQSNTTGNFANLTAQCYTVTVTDANNCTATTTFCVTQPTSVVVNITGTTSPTCTPGCDGTITVSANGGTAAITLLSAPFLTQSPANTFINACAATNYVITATDANGCTANTSTTLTTPNAPTPVAATVTNATCNGQCNGTAQVTIVAGITYTIAPNNPGQNFNTTTGAVTGLCAGTYTVSATNALSCVGTTTFVITQPTAVAVNITGAVNPTSPIVCNGSAQANGSGGTGIITYTITAPGVINATTGAISALCDGCYTVTATDANSCTATTSFCVAAAVAALTPNITNIANATCFNTCTGTAQAGAVGGVLPYSYSIAPTVPSGAINATTGAITGLCAGTVYTVTVTDAVSTSATITVTVTQPTQVNISVVSTTQASCNPTCNAVAVVSANGGTPGYTYSIAPAAGITQNPAGTFTGLCAGTPYVVTATDANGCTTTVNVNITTVASPTPVANVLTNVTCFGLCNGTAQVTTVPGVTYTVAGPGTPAINAAGAVSGLCAGTYTITATNAGLCTGTTTITVTQPTQLTLALTTSSNPTCNPGCDGTALFTASGGVGTNVYSIAPATGTINASNGNASTLCAGTTYTVTVTNANGCTATATVLLSTPASPSVNITSTIPPTCLPGCDGGATASPVAGGVYSILPATGSINTSTGIASNLCAGTTYTITVANASNCTAQTTVTLTTPGSPNVTIANTTTPSCVPGCDGTATPNPQAGLTYSISPAATINASTGAASNLCAGVTYTITATDVNGCTGQTTVNLTAPVPSPVNIVSSTQPNCVPGCNGTATPTAIPGAVYTIAPSGTINSNTGVSSNLCAGITYTITATTSNGCSATTTILLNTPANPTVSITAQTNPTGPVNCDGIGQATGAGGLAPYTYTIAGTGTPIINAATGAMSNLCGACYTITVTDANGCTATTTTCLINPLVVTAVGTNATCFGVCNGTGQATAQGGSQGGYTYAITGGASIVAATGAISNLCAGTIYTITVTDANSAIATTTLQISGPTQINFNVATTTSPTCVPGCDGTISIAANGGTPGYTYTLASPAGMTCTPTQPTPGNFNNLGAGTYTITVTDANGCTKTSTVVVTPSGVPVINSVTGTNPLCNNQCNGIVVTNATGATSYTLQLGNTTNATGTFNGLCAGTYTVTASNVAGCSVTATVTLANPSALTVNTNTSTNAPCFGLNGGSITYNVTGGTGGITYTSNPALVGAGGVYPNVGAGTYTITASDVNNCSVSQVFTITQPTALNINSVSVASPLCSNQSNGVITLNVSGGTGLYTTSSNPVSTPVGPAASPLVITGLSPLTYTVTITDANNCTITSAVTVPGSVPIVITSVNVTAPLCNTSCNGSITVAANGGNGTLTYTINPSGPAANTTGLFNSLCGGTYTVTVTDINACTQTTAATVTPPPALTFSSISSTNPLCAGNNNGTITVTTTGGTGLPVISITPASNQPTPGNFTGLTAQSYTVVATDANLCSTSTVITLVDPAQLVWNNPTSTNVTCFGGNNGTITSPATGGTGTKTYSITPAVQASNTTGLFTNLTAQCYTITVLDVQGCSLTRVVCITQPPAITFNPATVVNVLCFGAATGSISISANGGTSPFTYAIAPANGTQPSPGVFENLLAGTYAVIATDANGCTASSTNILISQPPAITFTSVTVQDVACFGDATGTISVTAQGGVGGIQFSIQPSGNQASPGFFSGLYAGTYTVSAVDGNNCVVTSLVTVGSNPQLRLNSVTLTEPICFGDNNGAIAATAVGGVAPIQFSLNNSPFQNNGTFNNLYAGYYIMTLRDAIGCLEDTLINLTQPTEVGAIVQTTAALCVDSEDGKVKITGTGGRGGYKYYLTPGLYINKSGVFSGLAIGTYTLRVVDTAGCEYRNVFNINPPANPLNNFMTKTDLGCFGRGNEGQATANVLGGTPPYNFLWNTSPAQTTATASTLYFGLYKVQITDANGCAIKDSVYISEGPCCDVAFIPNAFSPNGDGNNDEFRILTSAGVELQQLEIFNRWGQSVWKSNDVHRAWNGYIGGQEAPLDTYYYVLRYKCNRDNETYTKKGDVILVR